MRRPPTFPFEVLPLVALVLGALGGCGGAGAVGESATVGHPSTTAASHGDDRRASRAGQSADAYVAMLEGEGRAGWQTPEVLVGALGITPGMRVADVGTGSGYFLPLLNAAVGEDGVVVAEDIDPEMVEHVRGRVAAEQLSRVEPRLGDPDDPALEASSYHRVVLIDTFHHLRDPESLFRHVAAALAADGRFIVIDFPPGDQIPVGVSGHRHRVAKRAVYDAAAATGLIVCGDRDVLRYQFFVELCRVQ